MSARVDVERMRSVWDAVADASVDTVVCFGVLQHLPRREPVASLFADTGRVLHRRGEALVQLPVVRSDIRSRVWRLAPGPAAAAARRRGGHDITLAAEYGGTRLTWRELEPLLVGAGLRLVRE